MQPPLYITVHPYTTDWSHRLTYTPKETHSFDLMVLSSPKSKIHRAKGIELKYKLYLPSLKITTKEVSRIPQLQCNPAKKKTWKIRS